MVTIKLIHLTALFNDIIMEVTSHEQASETKLPQTQKHCVTMVPHKKERQGFVYCAQ